MRQLVRIISHFRSRRDRLSSALCVLAGAGLLLAAGANASGPSFDTPSVVAVGTYPTYDTTADVDDDGNPDVLVADWASNTVSVLLGDGTGSFTRSSVRVTGDHPDAITTADFDDDGNLDMAVAKHLSDSVDVLLGDGSGGFVATPATPIAVGAVPTSIASGDFDGDGTPDLAVANGGDFDVEILLGDGSGGFTPAAARPAVGAWPLWVTVADLDGDAKPDLVVTNSGGSVSILLGDGSGGFADAPGSPFTTGRSAGSAAVGDFDHDGNPDVALGEVDTDTVGVFLGDGTGRFAEAAGSPVAVGDGPLSLRAADLDGDGNLDLVFTNNADRTVQVLAGDGAGRFDASAAAIAVGGSPSSVAVADFDLSGLPDLAVANTADDTVSIVPAAGAPPGAVPPDAPTGVVAIAGNGEARVAWTPPASTGGAPIRRYTVTASPGGAACTASGADRAHACLVTGLANGTATTFAVTARNSTGTGPASAPSAAVTPLATGDTVRFAPRASIAVTTPTGLAAGDFDRDGHVDLAVTDDTGPSVDVLLGDGDGGFVASGSFAVGAHPVSPLAADLDGDGILDLTVVNDDDSTVSVLLGDGSGGFRAAAGSPFAVCLSPTFVAAADLDLDGRPDLVVPCQIGRAVTVLLGTGAGGFAAAPASPVRVGSTPTGAVAGDLDGDGKPDVAVANSKSDTVSVLLGDGTGRLADAAGSPVAAGVSPLRLVAADVDGNGDSDLAVTDAADSLVTVLLGTGTGGFAAAPGSPPVAGASPTRTAAGDVDGDGRIDLVVADPIGAAAVLVGRGTGAFAKSDSSPLALGTVPVGIVVADFDEDGRTDIASADATSNTISVLLNRTPPRTTAPAPIPAPTPAPPTPATPATCTPLRGSGTVSGPLACGAVVTTSEGDVSVTIPAGAFAGSAVVTLFQVGSRQQGTSSIAAMIVQVAVTTLMNGTNVARLDLPVVVHFAGGLSGVPEWSAEGRSWHAIGTKLRTADLPAGADFGYVVNADHSIDVITRNAVYLALMVPSAPVGVSARLTHGQVVLRWRAGAGGAPINRFAITRNGRALTKAHKTTITLGAARLVAHGRAILRIVGVDRDGRRAASRTRVLVQRAARPSRSHRYVVRVVG